MPFSSQSESELIAAYKRGQEAALTVLIERYLPSIFRYLSFLSHDTELAEDLTQETFVKMWRHLSRFNPEKSFKAWIFTIARNTAYDVFKKKNPIAFSRLTNEDESKSIDDIEDTQPLADAFLETKERTEELQHAIDQLSPPSRSILLLHNEEDLTFREISEIVGEPLNTVKSRYRRALQTLRGLLD